MNRQEIINGLGRKSRSRICSLVLSLSGCLLFAALLVLFDVTDSESRQLFRVTLRPSAANLVDGVEKIFGKALREEKSQLGGNHGMARVDDDGTPVIILNPNSITEEEIVHETFHLKMIGEGTPHITYLAPRESLEAERGKLIWLFGQLRSPIQHWMFYPEMRSMGLRPDRNLDSEMQKAIAGRSDLRQLSGSPLQFHLTVMHARVFLESLNVGLRQEFVKWAEAQMEPESIKKAEQIVAYVKEIGPKSPTEEAQVFLQCLNYLYRGTASFSPEPWSYVMKGNFRHHTARFLFQPKAQ
jgi:hypothetical protein